MDRIEKATAMLNKALLRASTEVISGAYRALGILDVQVTNRQAVRELFAAIRRDWLGNAERVAIAIDGGRKQEAEAALTKALASAAQRIDKAQWKALDLLIPSLRKLKPGEAVPLEAQAVLRDLQTVMGERIVTVPGRQVRPLAQWELVALLERTLGG